MQEDQQQFKRDFHTRNLDIIQQLRDKKLKEQETKDAQLKRKHDIEKKLKSRYNRDEGQIIAKQVSLPSINTPESNKRDSSQIERKIKIQDKQLKQQFTYFSYIENIKAKQAQEKQKKDELIQRQEQIKQQLKQKVLSELQEVAQFKTKDDLIDEQESDEEKIKIRKYPFITDLKAWKKKQRLDDSIKVFIISGGYPDIVKALQQRGWVRNPDSGSPCFDLKMTLHNSEVDYNSLQDFQMVNHFARVICLTTKVGLCKSINNLIWFHNVDKNTFFPRGFDLTDEEDFENFKLEFKRTKAEALLKMYIHFYKQKDPILLEKIKDQAEVALRVCQRQLLDINDLIDQKNQPEAITSQEWETLSMNDQSVEALAKKKHAQWFNKRLKKKVNKKKKKQQKQDEDEQLLNPDEFTNQVMEILRKFKEKFPQYYLNGHENIWIIKPAGLSRGRGITCLNSLDQIEDYVISKGAQWVAQKYIEKPLIVMGKKMDIRQWVLVTDWNPLTVWVYEECYLRFSAEEYDPKNLDNKMAHLTNNSIQKKGDNFYKSDIEGNMWTQQQFTEYLSSQHNVDFIDIIRPQIEQIAVWALLSVQDQVEQRSNSHELFGYDYMVDDKFKVWLIEVNSSPDFSYSTHVTEKLVKEVSEDLIKVIIDKPQDKKCSTGKFKRVYKGKSVVDKTPTVGLNLCLEGKQMKRVKG